MFRRLRSILAFPFRHHLWLVLPVIFFSATVISEQISDRHGFANSELHEDVMMRWGSPIKQASPSVRYVGSGTVFQTLAPLPFERQSVRVDAEMSYRKRGLVYFSGFDFTFSGIYEVQNPEDRAIELVFVFPIPVNSNRALLSELSFTVDGEVHKAHYSAEKRRLTWTGRLEPGARAQLEVRFQGRGLEHFVYDVDPSLPVRNFDFFISVAGGDNFDYPHHVMPAHSIDQREDQIDMRWHFSSLESGVPVGAVLPSSHSFDQIIVTMARRSWAPFLAFFAVLLGLAALRSRRLALHEALLVSSGYAFFFVLLAYLAAFVHFYLAYALTSLIIVSLLTVYLRRVFGPEVRRGAPMLCIAFLVVPTLAVVLEGYTGLIYTLEILGGLTALMLLSTREEFGRLLAELFGTSELKEATHES